MNLSEQRIARLLRLLAENPTTLKFLALEAFWSASARSVPTLPLSWPLPRLSNTIIRWPTPVPLPDAKWWGPKLRAGLAAHARIVPGKIDHPFTSIIMFDAIIDGREHRIAIDYRDTNEVPSECADSADLYFKLQFSGEGYPQKHVLPGGYVVGQQKFYRYLPWLRGSRRDDPTIEVYGRFGLRGEGFRREVLADLTGQAAFPFYGGLGTVLYSQSLTEVARAKVAIDLPGHGWFCYRLLEYFAIGSCVVAVPHGNKLHVPLEDRKHLAYTRPDAADIVDLCSYYLEHAAQRDQLMTNAQEYFDRYLHYRQLGAYYLSSIFERLH